jgi:hypothetical protein
LIREGHPITSSFPRGFVVPIPTLPLELSLIFSDPAVVIPRVSAAGRKSPVFSSQDQLKEGAETVSVEFQRKLVVDRIDPAT